MFIENISNHHRIRFITEWILILIRTRVTEHLQAGRAEHLSVYRKWHHYSLPTCQCSVDTMAVAVNRIKHSNGWNVLINALELVELIVTRQPISCASWMTSHDETQENFSFSAFWDPTAEQPIGSKEGPAQPPRAALLLVGSWTGGSRSEAITGSEADWSTSRRNEALLPNLRAQRHREVLFTLSSRFSVQFGSVESSCVAIDWFCVCTADHTSVIFTIIIEIYRVVVFLLWSPPGLSPDGHFTVLLHQNCYSPELARPKQLGTKRLLKTKDSFSQNPPMESERGALKRFSLWRRSQ